MFSVRLSRAHDTAEQINAFLAQTLIAADPMQQGPRDLSVLALLGDASNRLAEDDLRGDDAALAALHVTLGRAYLNLWLVREAEPHLQTAVDTLRVTDPRGTALPDALMSLGRLHASTVAYAKAETAFRECLDRRRTLGADDETLAETCVDLARVLVRRDQAEEAEQLVRDALALRGGLDAETLGELALIRASRGERDDAVQLFDHACELDEAAVLELGADLYRNLGENVFRVTDQGEHPEARDQLQFITTRDPLLPENLGGQHESAGDDSIAIGLRGPDTGSVPTSSAVTSSRGCCTVRA